VRVVLIEDASRFARDLMTQELGILSLANRDGVRVITASGDDLTDTSDPMKIAMRQDCGRVCAIGEGAASRQAQRRTRAQKGNGREGGRTQELCRARAWCRAYRGCAPSK